MQRISQSDIKVTKDDQAQINNFSKLYQKRQELQESLIRLREKVNQHQDTIDQIEFSDDDEILKYRFGSCFFHMPTDQVRTLVEKQIEKVKGEEKKTAKQQEDVEKKMSKLKATLYSKFGDSINLEE